MSTTIPQLPSHAVLEVRPGDQTAAAEVDVWLQEYATTRDPGLRERVILAYLGLADRDRGTPCNGQSATKDAEHANGSLWLQWQGRPPPGLMP